MKLTTEDLQHLQELPAYLALLDTPEAKEIMTALGNTVKKAGPVIKDLTRFTLDVSVDNNIHALERYRGAGLSDNLAVALLIHRHEAAEGLKNVASKVKAAKQ